MSSHPCGSAGPISASRPVRLHVQPFRRTHPDARDLGMDPERTVVTETYHATSLISTLRDRWNLGTPFSGRDATARSFSPVLSLDKPRAQSDWPDIVACPVEPMPESLMPLDAPVNGLGKALLAGLLALEQRDGCLGACGIARCRDHRRGGHRDGPRCARRHLSRYAIMTGVPRAAI